MASVDGASDVVATGVDAVGTGADAVGTATDAVGTATDAVGTATDAVGTGADAVGTATDAIGTDEIVVADGVGLRGAAVPDGGDVRLATGRMGDAAPGASIDAVVGADVDADVESAPGASAARSLAVLETDGAGSEPAEAPGTFDPSSTAAASMPATAVPPRTTVKTPLDDEYSGDAPCE